MAVTYHQTSTSPLPAEGKYTEAIVGKMFGFSGMKEEVTGNACYMIHKS